MNNVSISSERLEQRPARGLKVVFFNPGGGLGGGERSLLDLIGGLKLARPGWVYTVVAAAPGPFVELARQAGCEVLTLPLPRSLARLGDSELAKSGRFSSIHKLARLMPMLRAGPETAAYLWRLRRLFADLKPDLIHSNGLKGHLLTAWTAPGKIPVIWHIRDYVSPRPLVAPLLRASAFRCAATITNSRSVAEDAGRSLTRRVPIVTAYDAVDLDQFLPDGSIADLDALSGLAPPDEPVVRIGLLGTFAKWKGHQVLFRALAGLPRDPGWRAYVVGDAVYETGGSQFSRDALERMAADCGVPADRLGFAGFVAQPEMAFRALDIVVHASTQPEPFGRVIVEGMACAKAVIVSSAGGAAELVVDGQNAVAYPPGDDKALAARLIELLRDPELRSSLGAAGHAYSRRFGFSRIEADILPVYRAVLGTVLGPEACA